jgi:hypothetical protein
MHAGGRSAAGKFNRDYYGGALMMAIGLGAIIEGRQYPLGTLSRMGPGFFPVALGAILALVGLAIIATARFTAASFPQPSRWCSSPRSPTARTRSFPRLFSASARSWSASSSSGGHCR